MSEKIIIGPINKGLRNDRTAFVIDNDSFPTLINAYQWRGRVKRKRGTSLLGRLSRFIGTTDGSGSLTITINPHPILPGQVTFTVGTTIFIDGDTNIAHDPVNLITNGPGTATLNRTTGVLTITTSNIAAAVIYFPSLPVMGLEDLALQADQFPGTIAFDTKYSYNILTVDPYNIYDISFYKNPAPDASLPGYVPKTTWTPISWNGQDYQQFWTTNYQGALWATNGINVPFSVTNIGMQFTLITGATIVAAGPPAIVTLATTGSPAVIGDFVFINEIQGMTGINFQSGYVISIVAGVSITVEFPNATIAGAWTAGGIIQYLTNRSDTTKDCIRWYDGDPTNGNVTLPVNVQGKGWVNFMPPLSQGIFSISDLPARQYYLVGARMIVPFKDRLLFLGPVVQASSGLPIYLQDTIVYSQNGTPYYTVSYTNSPNAAIDTPTSSTNIFTPILVPINQTATSTAWLEDQTGFGGFISAGLMQDMITVSANEDALIVGFNFLQTRLVYTGNDIVPFNLFVINSELGSGSTFSVINMDQGVMTRGSRGFIITNQTSCQRIDLEIPDEVFELNNLNNGTERFCAQRDFINEWVYFTFPINSDVPYKFPNQTLQYNYRDNSWAIFNECYTTYGSFRKLTGFIWSTVGRTFPTWSEWNEPWNAGSSTLLEPKVIAGNQQGFVLVRDEGTSEATSLTIQNIIGSTVTSPNHTLNEGDYIIISGVFGTVSSQVNGKIFSVQSTTTNTFLLSPAISVGTYLGGGLIERLYVPFIQTKQFPVAWDMSRKTRLGPQRYLLSTTTNSQITLLIFLSQNEVDDPSLAYNIGNIVPDPLSLNNSLIYSNVLYTCPESTNLGLTPANTNLQMIVNPSTGSTTQNQIWHRVNTSLIGDTIQVGFTLSDAQMRSLTPNGTSFSITAVTSGTTTILFTTANFGVNQLVIMNGFVGGMTQLNGNVYIVISSTTSQVVINVDSTGFDPYVSGGFVMPVAPINQSAEIELHSIILEVSPSMELA